MRKATFLAGLCIVVSSLVGCNREDAPFDEDFEPIKAAFTAEELGRPPDSTTLSQTDKDFLNALWERDAAKAKALLAEGANARLDYGYGCTALMLAGATGDAELVAAMMKAGAEATPGAEPFLEVARFGEKAKTAEFRNALAEIARLAGKKPAPHEHPGVYSLELEARTAASFLENHHERLLKKGCYVFLFDQNFGFGDKPDVLLIAPTRDKYAIMAYTGVNGINYEIENFLVIKWMKRLETGHPYTLTGCGFDFLSGRFNKKIADPAGMAKAMYAFCPDIVDQGTGSVKALARELKKTNELYFWWD